MHRSIVAVECDHAVLLTGDADRRDRRPPGTARKLADRLAPGDLERIPPRLRILLADRRCHRWM
jgi:hypothetical protein